MEQRDVETVRNLFIHLSSTTGQEKPGQFHFFYQGIECLIARPLFYGRILCGLFALPLGVNDALVDARVELDDGRILHIIHCNHLRDRNFGRRSLPGATLKGPDFMAVEMKRLIDSWAARQASP